MERKKKELEWRRERKKLEEEKEKGREGRHGGRGGEKEWMAGLGGGFSA